MPLRRVHGTLRLPSRKPVRNNRRQFVDWLVAELNAQNIELPPYWTYGHLREAVVRWRHRLEQAGR